MKAAVGFLVIVGLIVGLNAPLHWWGWLIVVPLVAAASWDAWRIDR